MKKTSGRKQGTEPKQETSVPRKKEFRAIIKKFLKTLDELDRPNGMQKFVETVFLIPRMGMTHAVTWRQGCYTTGAYTFIARYNNPRSKILDLLNEELHLDLVRENEEQLINVCRVQLKCSEDGTSMQIEVTSSTGSNGERVPIRFGSLGEFRSGMHSALGFATLVETVFERSLNQSHWQVLAKQLTDPPIRDSVVVGLD